MSSLDSLKPGQKIKLTVVANPKTANSQQTIERLMRQDPTANRSLRKAHRMRQQRLNVYNRGNRDWTAREICARIVRSNKGNSWTMIYSPVLANDIASIAKYVTIENA